MPGLTLETEHQIPTQEAVVTSRESRDQIKHNSHQYRMKIFDLIQITGGMTCDEVEVELNMRHQTASCFIRFLTQDGYLRDSGEQRVTRAGRKAIVWKTARYGNEQLKLF
jgi:predicted transcriptional regulator